MSFLTELAADLNREQGAVPADLWPSQGHPEFPAAVLKLADEIGDDEILAEAALKWVKQKKRDMILAKIGTLYTPEELEALKKRLSEPQVQP